jgi:ketosteroid isomerase-like protein
MNQPKHLSARGAGETTSMRRAIPALVLAACAVALAACSRGPDTSGDSPQVAAAKGAVAHRLGTMNTAEFRQIVEYRDGVVCGEFDSHKMFSSAVAGFRKFIYNAPEPGALAIDAGNLSPQEIGYWCSEQPDKRLRMVAASLAELAQACRAAGGKSSDTSCRLAAEQKRTLDELQAEAAHPAAVAAASASAPGVAAAPQAAQVPPGAEPAAATASLAASSGNGDAAILGEVQAALGSWRQAWQDGDVDAYLRMYGDAFGGEAGSHAKWAQQRRQKMQNARPSIGIEDMKAVRVTPQEVELHFTQVYAAKQHRDTGDKTLVFRRSPRGWLIADERWKARP